MLSRDTLMSGAKVWAFHILTHAKLPQGGHSRSWHCQEMVKVLSDSSHEPADDKSLLALGVIPVGCQQAREQLRRRVLHT